ncbi:MAG TPA: class I SAM-dependent methyltransferase, partial [Thermoanaerobaculia bacterium]|nr:class I SAM-dependent methyltransferase [Thermoanaerobaculia bacterium]
MSDVVLRETEIRPDHLMKGQEERFAADIARLLAHRAGFVEVNCPACESPEKTKAFEKYTLTYVNCTSCETMYISPRPMPPHLEDYYSSSENYAYWNNYIFPASEDARRDKIFRPRAERIVDIAKRHGKEHGTLLEVGSGFGTFCQEVQRVGTFGRVIAVEPTKDLAETCRKRGLEVIEKPIEHVKLESGSVDLIASFEVIEHLFSPKEFLQSCNAVLSSGGLLILTCPNGKGFDILELQALAGAVDVEHLNYFNPKSLALLLDRCGFDTLESTTPGKLD